MGNLYTRYGYSADQIYDAETDDADDLSDDDRMGGPNFDNEGYYVGLFIQSFIDRGLIDRDDIHIRDHVSTAISRPPNVPKKLCLDKLKNSSIYENVKQSSGYSDPNWSILKMLSNREHGITTSSRYGLSAPERCKINNHFLPNKCKEIMRLNTKIFCGKHSKDGNFFVTASQDGILGLYDANTPQYKRLNRVHGKNVNWAVLDIDISPDSQNVVYSTWSSMLQIAHIHDTDGQIDILPLDPVNSRTCIFSVVFSNCGTKIIGGSNEGQIYLFDRELNQQTTKFPVKQDVHLTEVNVDVNAVGFLDDTSNIMFSGSDEGVIKLWDLRELNEQRPKPIGIMVGHYDGITSIHAKNDCRYLISNSKDQSIKLWDVRVFSKSGAEHRSLIAQKESHDTFSWDYRYDSIPRKFYTSKLHMDDDVSVMTYRGHRVAKTLQRAKFSPVELTGQRYIYTGCASGRLVFYDVLTGQAVHSLAGHDEVVRDVSWHPYRQEVLTTSWDSTVNLNTYAYNEPEKRNSPLMRNQSNQLRRSKRIAQQQSTGQRHNYH